MAGPAGKLRSETMTRPVSTAGRSLRIASSMREVAQGDLATGARGEGLRLFATLGSCVAVMLHDPDLRLGGMVHINRCVDPGPLGGAMVVSEVERLVNALMRRGAGRVRLAARLVGGARTLGRGRDFGGDIARTCVAYVSAEGFELLGADLGGSRPRRIAFDPASGDVEIAYPGRDFPTQHDPIRGRAGDAELF